MGLRRHGGLETALRAPGDCGSLENPYDGSVVKVLGHKAACWSSKVGLWEGTHRKFLGPREDKPWLSRCEDLDQRSYALAPGGSRRPRKV